MNRSFTFKIVLFSLVLVMLAAFLLAWPRDVVHAITTTHYDYCIVSGSTLPLDVNGTYYYDDIYNGRSSYALGWYSIYYQGASVWQIGMPGEVWYFTNSSSAIEPPASGWSAHVDYSTGSPTVTCGYGQPPSPSVSQSTPEPTKTPITYVFGDGLQVNLSCQKTLAYGLVVPGGDLALLDCPVAGLATDDKLKQEELPAGVTGGTFVAAFELEISGGGAPLSVLPTPWIAAFKIPEGVTADKLAILFWDAANNKWVELPTAVNLLTDKVTDLGNGRKVIVGTHQYTRTHVAATLNFTGIFVLIQK